MATGQLAPAGCRQRRLRLAGIPVFLYHGLTTCREAETRSPERKYWISAAQFQDHLDQICSEGYRVAALRELWDRPGAFNDEKPPVVLTFDDGWASDYHVAYPLLLEAGVRADFFVSTGTVGKRGFVGWQQIAEMQRTGMSFQSHSHDHVDLVRCSVRTLEQQLRDSKRRLEDRLACSVDFLAVPYGFVNGRVVKVAQQEGYRAVCTSCSWPARPGVRKINRVPVYRHTTSREFSRLLARTTSSYAARMIRSALVYVPKRFLLRFRPAQLSICPLEEQA